MTRKKFLQWGLSGAAVFIGAGLTQGCKNSTTPSNPADQHTFTSSSEPGHAHTITLSKSDIDSPPAAGISKETSVPTDAYVSSHTHTFVMIQADLLTVKGGTAVAVVTGVTNSHQHTFTITKWY